MTEDQIAQKTAEYEAWRARNGWLETADSLMAYLEGAEPTPVPVEGES